MSSGATAIVRREAAAFAAVFALGFVLRVPWLGAIPAPAGDEGNWALVALRLSEGVHVELAPDARFVTLAFARMIARVFGWVGPSFAAARAVPVAALLGAMTAAWGLSRRAGAPRAGLAIAWALAVHPWSVLWSRTVSVPYAFSFALGVVGPLAFLDALRTRSVFTLFVAAQLTCASVHFSPLGVLPLVACVLHALMTADARTLLKRRVAWAACISGVLHFVPVIAGTLTALRTGRQTSPDANGPIVPRLLSMARMMVNDLSGDSSARHFAGHAAWSEILGAIIVLTWLARSLVPARDETPLARFGRRYFFIACGGLPLILVAGRAWDMPVIDADRYGFALVAPLALWFGGGLSPPLPVGRGGWGVRSALALALVWALVTGRTVAHFVAGGGGDQGLFVAAGGGRYRGWQAPQERTPLPDLLCDTVLAHAQGEPVTLAYGDYAFHPVRFSIAARRAGARITHSLGVFTFAPRRRVFFALWADEAFTREYVPQGVVEANRALRERVIHDYDEALKVTTFAQPDGTPLVELWSARAR